MNNRYRLPEPAFGSELVTLLFEIERLRANIGAGTTPRETYIELHHLFDTVMSVVSARIEGNHTTVYEALEGAAETSSTLEDHLREIANITEAARYIDTLDPQAPISHSLIRDLHARTVDGLVREGDPHPGSYRDCDVAITASDHTPPSWVTVHAEMTELLGFANTDFPLPQQMLQVAQAHHRFVWIHPFRNGNGRVSRLFTYAMLRKTIFATRGYSALNPTSVFGNDRSEYISALEGADSLSLEGTTEWATFFARGIRDDLKRLIDLQDHKYVITALIDPVIQGLSRDGVIGPESEAVLRTVLRAGVVKAGDLTEVLPGSPTQRSRAIRNLLDRRLLRHALEGPRFYRLSLSRGPIAQRLIRRLDELGLLPRMLSED